MACVTSILAAVILRSLRVRFLMKLGRFAWFGTIKPIASRILRKTRNIILPVSMILSIIAINSQRPLPFWHPRLRNRARMAAFSRSILVVVAIIPPGIVEFLPNFVRFFTKFLSFYLRKLFRKLSPSSLVTKLFLICIFRNLSRRSKRPAPTSVMRNYLN